MERTSKPWDASLGLSGSGKGKSRLNHNDLSVNALHNQLLQSVAISGSRRNRQRDAYGGAVRSASPSADSGKRSKSPEIQRPSYASSPSHSSITGSLARSQAGSSQPQQHSSPRLTVVPKPSTSLTSTSAPVTPVHADQDDGRRTPPPSYEETELDAFLTRISLNPEGATYEDLLLLEEINGPASIVQQRNLGTAEQPFNVSVASVELLHKRTTKDGRSKLKLVLAGMRVETCGICLAQFKPKEKGAITDCKHCFHEKCLQKWLARKDSFPTCRQCLRDAVVN